MEAGAMKPMQHGSACLVLSVAFVAVFRKESGPSGRDLLIAEPGTEKECPRRLVRTDYRASDPKTPVRIRARALQGNQTHASSRRDLSRFRNPCWNSSASPPRPNRK